MAKTLQLYIGKDLLRATLLSLVVFTLVLTVFAIMEPLRKEGLGGLQVLILFFCTLPIMLSFTLPIAALFATSIVYGRFSQENELLASNASGISTMTVLTPAIILGVSITILSWVLSNYTTPRIAEYCSKSMHANVAPLVYRRLANNGTISWGRWMIHADAAYEKQQALRGVIVIDLKDREERKKEGYTPAFFAAESARTAFDTDKDTGNTFAHLEPSNMFLLDKHVISGQSGGPIENVPIPRKWKEKPGWYSWNRICDVLKDETKHGEVKRILVGLKRDIQNDTISRLLSQKLATDGVIRLTDQLGDTYEIKAPNVQNLNEGTVRLMISPPSDRGEAVPVTVSISRGGKVTKRIFAPQGTLHAKWSQHSETSQLSISLKDPAIYTKLASKTPQQTRKRWEIGQLTIPNSLTGGVADMTLKQIFNLKPEEINSERIGKRLANLQDRKAPGLMNDILAEMHSRVAYSLSCTVLILLGAALGTIFRGGQIISAFAISVVPASLVIILIVMGKRLVKNPDIPASIGLAVIWSGLAGLLLITVFICSRLARR